MPRPKKRNNSQRKGNQKKEKWTIKGKPTSIKSVTGLSRHLKRLDKTVNKHQERLYRELNAAIQRNDINSVKKISDELRRLTVKGKHLSIPRKKQQSRLLQRDNKFPAVLSDRAFSERVNVELSKPGTHSLTIIDLDKFHDFNEAHGHAGGDIALKIYTEELARIATNNKGFAGRHGGEELALYLPHGERKVERLLGIFKVRVNSRFEREKEKLNATLSEKKRIKKLGTFSAGVSSKTNIVDRNTGRIRKGTNYAEMMQEADSRLFHSKNQGRDRLSGSKAVKKL